MEENTVSSSSTDSSTKAEIWWRYHHAALIAEVGLTGLVKAKDHFLPLIMSSVRGLTIPGASTSQFSYKGIHIKSASLTCESRSNAPQ